MADHSFALTARSALGDLQRNFGDIRLAAVDGLAIVSLAPSGATDKLKQAVTAQLHTTLPAPGDSSTASLANGRLLGLARDQWFWLFDDGGPEAFQMIAQQLEGIAYLTDQSDSWVAVRVAGENCRAALERICPLDLDNPVFPVGHVGRTVMQHLGVIVLREKADSFLLLSARSSAQSFWHMIETSAAYVS